MLFKWVQNETCSVVVAGGGLACAGRCPALQNALLTEETPRQSCWFAAASRCSRKISPASEENGFGARVTVWRYAERWTYNFGKREFMQFVTVENGVITDIADGPREDDLLVF